MVEELKEDLILIDSPVGPFSPPAEIRAWLEELGQMQPTKEVKEAIDEAERWLELQQENS